MCISKANFINYRINGYTNTNKWYHTYHKSKIHKKDDKRERNLESPYAARDPTVRLITVLTSAAIKLFAKYFPNVKYSNISL